MNILPPALRPIYTTDKPNDNILLYEGLLEISSQINQHKVQIQGNGKLEYVWFPNPRIQFSFSNKDQNIDIIPYVHANNLLVALTLLDIEVLPINISITSSSSGNNNGNFVSGRVTEAITQGNDKDLAYVLFHVVNFHDFRGRPPSTLKHDSRSRDIERMVFQANEWKVTLDQLETTTDNVKYLNSQGGFAITHVGKLEKLDGQTFSGEEAKEFLKIVVDFLSFARGFKVPLALLVGYDAENNKIWQHWEESVGHPWKYVNSWFPVNKAHMLANAFPAFVYWWNSWEQSAKLSLYWYLEANHSSLVEQQIILTQVALELIANAEEQTKGNASEKLRGLLKKYEIPVNIPFDNLSNKPSTLASKRSPESSEPLEKLVGLKNNLKKKLSEQLKKEINEKNKIRIEQELNQVDAPYLFTKIRNDIIHSKKKIENLETYLYEASDLGLWYLELVLLAIFDYQECYGNRLPKYQQNGEMEVVPWSNQGKSY
ncbi:MAG: hypothetical protein AAGE84_15120 [Cyanobacteria bacterium P01_G01_bin.39]